VFKRHSVWLLPLLAAAIVLSVGARLITLSVRERSAQLRVSADRLVTRHAAAIEEQLRQLSERAGHEAGRLATARDAGADSTPPASLGPATDTFWMRADGSVLRAPPGASGLAAGVAAEASAAPSAAAPQAAQLFGPVRYGSDWVVAARAPLKPGEAGGGWSVAYESLDALLAQARFGSLVREGYDFQLSQPDPGSTHLRQFLASQPGTLAQPSSAAVPRPAVTGAAPFFTLAIRPREGWYPSRELAAEIGLLALLAWAAAFAAYDLTHSLKRTQFLLATTRKRLHDVNQRLAGEIEQRELLQKSFEHARFHDAFTGLPNRRFFMDQLDRALREIRTRRRNRIAIVLIDIERLRLISDTLGHTAGDELLLQAAQRCQQILEGSEHLMARWGVDQLAVLLYQVESSAAAQVLADRLQQSSYQPFELRQHRLSVTSRVGFTCIDSGLQRTEEAVREADLALTVAREQQNQRALGYLPGMGGAAVSLVSLEADLHVALDRREFALLFQPIVDLRGQRVVGAEALLRWRHPVEGLLTPDKFLALAEEAGVIVPVTRWIIQRVCRLASEWRRRLPQGEDFYISVNLSAAVLRTPGLHEYVARVLDDTKVAPGHLKFELSEGGLISNASTARNVLEAFHAMGIELMLDDFGSGYSSLSYLQLFPFDYVKIDRPFVSRTGSERANTAITAAILQMASNLGLRAVAEVVETKAAAQTLLQMGCEYGQGFFFSPPVEAEEAFRQLRSSEAFGPAMTLAEGQVPVLPDPDESPTLMLPAGIILESKLKDETGESEELSATERAGE
jgi:diguanylate cyclase (GGDEF)-like protein